MCKLLISSVSFTEIILLSILLNDLAILRNFFFNEFNKLSRTFDKGEHILLFYSSLSEFLKTSSTEKVKKRKIVLSSVITFYSEK